MAGRGSAPGERRGGRSKGTPNKATVEVKQALTEAFSLMGDVPALVEWAKKNPGQFYAIWAKLLPQQHRIGGDPDNPTPIQTTLTPDERRKRIRELLGADAEAILRRGVGTAISGVVEPATSTNGTH